MKKMFRLTKDGVDALQNELDGLVAKRSSIAEAIKSARELGDLSENAEYQSAMAEKERNEARISEVQNILQSVEIIKKPRAGSKVQMGSKVKLKSSSKTKEFQIVGTVEADPLNGKISDESPIGRALIDKNLGDQVEIKTPAETTSYKVIEIS